MIRSHLIIAGIIVVGLAAGLHFLSLENETNKHTKPVGEYVVTLKPDGYEPSELEIPVGSTVTFVSETGKSHWPASNLHPMHEIYPEFDSKRPVPADESWSFTFDRAGTWDMHDHLRAYYIGTIRVVE